MPAAVAVPVATTVVGAGLSLMQGKSAQKAAGEAAEKQEALTREQMAERKQQYAEQERIYGPVRDKLIRENMAETPPDYEKYADTVKRNYGKIYRAPLAYGGNTGLGAAMVQGARMREASDLAGAYTQAKEAQRKNLMALLGKDQSVALGQAYAGGMSGPANLYGQQAAMLGQTAANQYGAAAKGLTDTLYGLGRWAAQPGETPEYTQTNFATPQMEQSQIQPTPQSDASLYPPSNTSSESYQSPYDWRLNDNG
jgi:hypothetical protein